MKVALAGAGAFGVKHLEAIAKIDGVEVVSLVGRLLEPTQEVARRFGVGHVATTLEESLARPDVDAVILCTPTQIHASQAIACLKAGKHVQVESPLADRLADAQAVVRLQKGTDKVAMAGHTRRFNCSDGDNWSDDNAAAIKAAEGLCEVSNLFGYAEIKPGTHMQSYLLAATAAGKFKSFFADKPVPPAEKKADGTEAPAQKEPIRESPETRIVVVGSSRFITNDIITQFEDNQVFFLNIIDWLTLGEQVLIGIRSRGATDRPLSETTEYTKTLVKALSLFGVPLAVAIFGMARFYLRRRRKRSEALSW